MGGVINKVKKGAGDVAGIGTLGLVGNNPMETLATSKSGAKETSETIQKLKLAGLTDAELARLGLIDETVAAGLGQTGSAIESNLQAQQDLNNLFRNVLIDFSTDGGTATPDQIAEATSFVDQTFTAGAQQALNQQIQDFQGQQDTRAAALGRQPDDIGYQAELFKTTADAQNALSLERGAQIAKRADEIAYNRPMTTLGTLGQTSNFFNNNAANLLSNQANLLNMASGQQDRAQRERQIAAESVQTETGTGLGSKTASPLQFGTSIIEGASTLGKMGV